jgi:hypothetical protein
MTEAEWLTCTNPGPMVAFLENTGSDRKLRLFAVACCRRSWDTLTDKIWDTLTIERLRRAVEVGEQYADGLVNDQTRSAAWDVVQKMQEDAIDRQEWERAAWILRIHCPVYDFMNRSVRYAPVGDWGLKCQLLRDIFGNPFRPASIDPTVLTWNGGTVPKLAQAIYNDRRFSDLPILADALEEAGCDNADILAHCRSEGPHVRGCWVVDLILGKT